MEATHRQPGSNQPASTPDSGRPLSHDYPALDRRATDLREQLTVEGLSEADLRSVLATALLDAHGRVLKSARYAVTVAARQRVGHGIGDAPRKQLSSWDLTYFVESCQGRFDATTSPAVMMQQFAAMAAARPRPDAPAPAPAPAPAALPDSGPAPVRRSRPLLSDGPDVVAAEVVDVNGVSYARELAAELLLAIERVS